MKLRGIFDFSNVDKIVINQNTVFLRQIFGGNGKPMRIIWRKEHATRIHTHDQMIDLLQRYCDSRVHRIVPNGNTINIHHFTPQEIEDASDHIIVDVVKNGRVVKSGVEFAKAYVNNVPNRQNKKIKVHTPKTITSHEVSTAVFNSKGPTSGIPMGYIVERA